MANKTPERFAIRDAGEWTAYEIASNKAIVTLETIKTAQMDFSGETVYSRGGFGNPKLVGFSGNKEGKLALQDALFDAHAIAMITGNELKTAAKDIDVNDKLKVTSSKVTLSKTPKGAISSIYTLNPDGTNGDEFTLGTPATNAKEFSILGKVITFHTSVVNDTNVRVYYTVTTSATAKTMSVTSDAFGGTFKLVGKVLVRDSFDGKDYPAMITIPRAKFEDAFSLGLSVDSDPAVLDLPIEMLKDPIENELWTMTIYRDEDIA